MALFTIGNWEISNQGIKWKGTPLQLFSISIEEIRNTGFGERENMYDWLIHVMSRNWITREDVYALNSAYIFVFHHFNIKIDAEIFARTIKYQEQQFKFDELLP
jgi:hypothetical protein